MKKKKQTAAKPRKGFGTLDRQKAREDGLRALNILRRLKKGMSLDSIHEMHAAQLQNNLEILESWLGHAFPPPDRVSGAKLDLFEGE
jgi:hypothetical protein